MTRAHVAVLYFEGRTEVAKKRILKLVRAHLICERERRVNEASILLLSKRGLLLLRERGILVEYPSFSISALLKRAQISQLTIRHELEVMDVKTAFYAAHKNNPTLTMADFCTWPRLNEFKAYHRIKGSVVIRPDGFARICETTNGNVTEHMFFLEVDRSTETLDTLVSRVECYLEYYRRGGFAVRQGGLRHEYNRYPFRILIICKSQERRDNIAERLLKCVPPVLTHAYLSIFLDVVGNALGPIWRRPVDYQNRIDGCTGLFLQ